MAIDSTEKMLSLLNFGLPWTDNLPAADGALGSGDRLHLVNLYSLVTVVSLVVLCFEAVDIGQPWASAASMDAPFVDDADIGSPEVDAAGFGCT